MGEILSRGYFAAGRRWWVCLGRLKLGPLLQPRLRSLLRQSLLDGVDNHNSSSLLRVCYHRIELEEHIANTTHLDFEVNSGLFWCEGFQQF